jgi:thymidylate synthase (FAD)
MQTIKAYAQIYDDLNSQDILKKIERCGRVCYKSEGKIEEGSAEKFITNIIKRGHEAVLEHGSFIIETTYGFYSETISIINELEEKGNFISYLRFTDDSKPIISGNVRAWRDFFKVLMITYKELPFATKEFIQSNPVLFPEFQYVKFRKSVNDYDNFKMLDVCDLKTEIEKLTHLDITVKFMVDRGVSHEIVRHRPASYCQESTRYCNYSKEDFGKQIAFIIPHYLAYNSEAWNTWKESMEVCEDAYFKLLDIGHSPQEARAVLPNSLKTELVMTANLREWRKFFELRTPNSAHPQMREVTRPLLDEFKELIPILFDDIRY